MTTTRPDILLRSGRYFNFVEPDAATVTIEDVAWGLSHVCRFAGHTNQFYSVAQHSVLVSHLVPPEFAFAGLMHDAPEAFIGDIPKPLKKLLPDYREIEKRVERVVLGAFGLTLPLPPEVKRADLIALATEQRDLMPLHDDDWPLIADIAPHADTLYGESPCIARLNFVTRFRQLTEVGPDAR